MFTPLISICIPAYNQPELLQRCLDSIVVQTYKNIEIIISDDSGNDSVAKAIKKYTHVLTIQYFKNEKPLGSPSNWNQALDKATGALYLLLHHDDYLAAEDSLEQYRTYFEKQPATEGFFCKSMPVDDNNKPTPITHEPHLIKQLLKEPDHLIRSNQIGPPSNLMLRASVRERYNPELIWLVDVEFYIRLIKAGHTIRYIDKTLVYIGIHQEQLTQFCMNNPDIVLRENMLLARQIEKMIWRDLKFYDYFWRLFRNNHIRSENDLQHLGIDKAHVIPVLRKMLSDLSKMPARFIFTGIVSKAYMFISWARNKA